MRSSVSSIGTSNASGYGPNEVNGNNAGSTNQMADDGNNSQQPNVLNDCDLNPNQNSGILRATVIQSPILSDKSNGQNFIANNNVLEELTDLDSSITFVSSIEFNENNIGEQIDLDESVVYVDSSEPSNSGNLIQKELR